MTRTAGPTGFAIGSRIAIPGDSQQQVVKTTRFFTLENRVAANRYSTDSAPVQHSTERATLTAGAHQYRDIATVYRGPRDTGALFEHGADFVCDRLVNQLAHFTARVVIAIGFLWQMPKRKRRRIALWPVQALIDVYRGGPGGAEVDRVSVNEGIVATGKKSVDRRDQLGMGTPVGRQVE